MYIILFILIITQIILFKIIFDIKKNKIKPIKGGIFLKEIPKNLTQHEVSDYDKTIRDLLSSITLENWKFNIIEHTIDHARRLSYEINTESNDGKITIVARMFVYLSDSALYKQGPILVVNIYNDLVSDSINIKINEDCVNVYNESIVFFWEQIIEYHKKRNSIIEEKYKKQLDYISSNLKTLNRERKLNQIL